MAQNIYDAVLPLRFPRDFLWGAATAAHQVHGSPGSNWDAWERSPQRLEELREKGLDPNDFIAGRACEFETRYQGDFALAQQLGHNANRFSINWATVEPQKGEFNIPVLRRYRRIVLDAKKNGLEPIITLYHWTHPGWFEESGSWKQEDAAKYFARFVNTALSAVCDVATHYTVLNEPNVYANHSFRRGIWPPHGKDEDGYRTVLKQLALAHEYAYGLIKWANADAKVGIAQSVGWNENGDKTWNYEFIDSIPSLLDFIGLNLYFHFRDGTESKDPCTEHPVVSDIGWGMCPRAIYEVLKEFSARYPTHPLMITEHGHAVREIEDKRRCWYLWESLKWIQRAGHEGVGVYGYLHWSLLDNFEWASGFGPQFGLIHVNRKTQKRTPRASAHLLRDIIKAGALTQEIADKYWDIIKHPHE